jgi:hypothetical protein
VPCPRYGQRLEENGNVEVRPRNSLGDGETENQVGRGDLAGLYDGLVQQWNDDGIAAEDYGLCEVHVCKEIQESWTRVYNSTGYENGNECCCSG